jgi:hypothetical protein
VPEPLPQVLQQGPYEYVSIPRMRAEGVPASVSDADLREKIRDASDVINLVTGAIFVSVAAVVRVDGRSSGIVWLPNQIPIVKVNAMRYVADPPNDDLVDIDQDMYVVKQRVIESVSPQASHWRDTITEGRMWKIQSGMPFLFPDTPPLGIEIDGVFGWLERARNPALELELSADAIVGAQYVEVVNLGDVDTNDVLMLPRSLGRRLVTRIEVTTKKVWFDKQELRAALTTGEKCTIYGAVPRLVTKACALIVARNQNKIADPDYQSARNQDRIRSESTDNYSYTLGGSSGSSGGSGGWDSGFSVTGCEEADQLLSAFCPPPILEVV